MSLSISRPRRVLWSPYSNDSRVIAASHDIRLYSLTQGSTQFRHVGSLSDPVLQGWKCIAWCPDPSYPDIIGTGLYSGKIVLVRIPSADDVESACNPAFPSSLTSKTTTFGVSNPAHTTGFADVSSSFMPSVPTNLGPNRNAAMPSNNTSFLINTDAACSASRSTVPLSSSTLSEFSLRYPRTCHALDFNPVDPALMLSGHEKARNESCIFVWDIHLQSNSANKSFHDSYFPNDLNVGSIEHLSTGISSAASSSTTSTMPALSNHLRHHSGSSDFRRSSTHRDFSNNVSRSGFGSMILSAGTSTDDMSIQQANIASNRNSMPGAISSRMQPSVPVNQLGASESVSSVIWLRNHSRLILAGMGLKSLRLFDLRGGASVAPVLEYNTRAVFGVAPDPFNDHQFASYSDDAVIKVWDTRKSNDPVLVIPSQVTGISTGPTITHIAYSPYRQGILGAMYKDHAGICVYELINQPLSTTVRAEPPLFAEESDSITDRRDPETMCVLRKRTCGSRLAAAFSFMPTDAKGACQIVILARPTMYTHPSSVLATPSVSGPSAMAGHGSGPGPIPLSSHISSPSVGLGSITGTSPSGFNAANIPSNAAATLSSVSGEYRLELIVLPNTPQAGWNPNGSLAAATGITENTVTFIDPDGDLDAPYAGDLAGSMKTRALRGYSMNVRDNLKLIRQQVVEFSTSTSHDDTATVFGLKLLWHWISRMEQLVSSGRVTIGGLDFSWLGVQRVLQGLTGNVSTATKHSFSTIYTSPQRRLALNFCGWFGREELETELQRLEEADQYEKAALYAFLHSDLSRAIQSLLASKDEKLHLVSAAIAGYCPDPQPAWLQLCRSLSQELERPELRVMFTYFSTNNWSTVISENLEPQEKLLVALRYYGDIELLEYVEQNANQAIYEGNLQGILYTGLSPEGVTLVQRYVDNKGDVQTAALAMSYAVPRRFPDARVTIWVEEYRDFLDRQQMYHIRAHFDIALAKLAGPEHIDVAPQIQMRCNFCNQSISNNMFLPGIKDRDGRRVALSAATLGSIPKQKITVCPNCRKSLPRCSLCLLSIGSPIEPRRGGTSTSPVASGVSSRIGRGIGNHPIPAVGTSSIVGGDDGVPYTTNGFESWFTWCQTCRHGGHAGHILEYFSQHTTCPVADCDCPCGLL